MNAARIIAACTELTYAYARLIDFRDYEGFAALFADDGVLDVGQPLAGPAAIFASCMKRPENLRSRHVVSNVFVEPLSADTARGINYVTVYRHVGPASLERGPAPLDQPAAVGHYEDRYVCTEDGWRFANRKLHLAFVQENAF